MNPRAGTGFTRPGTVGSEVNGTSACGLRPMTTRGVSAGFLVYAVVGAGSAGIGSTPALFNVARSTVYRAIRRAGSEQAATN